ncbi:MAG: aspartate aminotransferase family protein [Deltaproteobacteria bacterium]|nr:aspartate aminotransferase family protein [Deltaproteobacteria bacterium]
MKPSNANDSHINEHWLTSLMQMRAKDNLLLQQRHINPSLKELHSIVGFNRSFVKASGSTLTDDKGINYHDFLSGFGVHNIGHNHPQVISALNEILATFSPSFCQISSELLVGLAAEHLSQHLPKDITRIFFCNSGSEAIDAAIKLARAATKKKRIVYCSGAYHGTTLGALSVTDNRRLRRRFGPLIPGVICIPFGNIEALEHVLMNKDIAALIIEPILAEGGVIMPPKGFLTNATALCKANECLIIADEIQCGMGRTGSFLACNRFDFTPDIITLAKALGGGLMPVGAMATRSDIFNRAYGSLRTCLDHTTTFSGGPLAMAAVIATLKVLDDEKLTYNAQEQGTYLKNKLNALRNRHPQIVEIRGTGLMMGVQFADVSHGVFAKLFLGEIGKASAGLFAQYIALRLIEEHHIITQVAANDPSVLKIMPPLAINQQQCDEFIKALDSVLSEGGHTKAWKYLIANYRKATTTPRRTH